MQAEAQQQEIEETTSVELEDTSTEEVVEDSKEVELQEDETTRTNVQDNDEELDQYSEGVQKRINKLTAARRKAEEEAAAAVQYIQQMQNENENIKQRLKTIDKGTDNLNKILKDHKTYHKENYFWLNKILNKFPLKSCY